jgi:hypothetical protein
MGALMLPFLRRGMIPFRVALEDYGCTLERLVELRKLHPEHFSRSILGTRNVSEAFLDRHFEKVSDERVRRLRDNLWTAFVGVVSGVGTAAATMTNRPGTPDLPTAEEVERVRTLVRPPPRLIKRASILPMLVTDPALLAYLARCKYDGQNPLEALAGRMIHLPEEIIDVGDAMSVRGNTIEMIGQGALDLERIARVGISCVPHRTDQLELGSHQAGLDDQILECLSELCLRLRRGRRIPAGLEMHRRQELLASVALTIAWERVATRPPPSSELGE